MLTIYRVSCPITDKKGLIIATLCGHPDDLNWESAHKEASAVTKQAQRHICHTKKNSRHRRGHFIALSAGVSFGGGQKVNTEILDERISNQTLLFALQDLPTYLGHVTPCSTCMVCNFKKNFTTGSTILLPSAVIQHSNVAIQKVRSSICSLNTSRQAFLMGRPQPPEDEYYSSLLEDERIVEEEAV